MQIMPVRKKEKMVRKKEQMLKKMEQMLKKMTKQQVKRVKKMLIVMNQNQEIILKISIKRLQTKCKVKVKKHSMAPN